MKWIKFGDNLLNADIVTHFRLSSSIDSSYWMVVAMMGEQQISQVFTAEKDEAKDLLSDVHIQLRQREI